MNLRDIAVTLVIAFATPFMIRYADVGVYFWAWVSYMNPHKQAWGFAQTMPFAMWVAICTLMALLIWKEPKRIPWTRETVLLALFVVWMCVTTVFATNPLGAVPQLDKVLKIQVMTFVTLMVINTRRRIETLLWVIALSIGYYGIKGGIFTIMTGGGFHVLGPAYTFIAGNNEIALALLMVVPLFRYFQLQATFKWMRIALASAMFLCVVAAVGTQSRGALVALIAMATMLILKSRKRFLLMGLTLATGSFILSFMPQTWWDRMLSIGNYEQDNSALGRINAWWFAFNLAKDRVFGGGFETFTPRMFNVYSPDPNRFVDAHSIYFEVMAEHGFVGLGLFLSIFVFGWFKASALARQARQRKDLAWVADLMQMTQVSLLAYAAGGLFLGLAYWDLPYHLVGMVILCDRIAKMETTEHRSSIRRWPGMAHDPGDGLGTGSSGQRTPGEIGAARRRLREAGIRTHAVEP
jgi:probable O-glycosylation ligase (exosortase A-associated)